MTDFKAVRERIEAADVILVGASNGFSIAEGLHLFADNAAFEQTFGDFKRKYDIHSILQGAFFQWPSEEEKWAFTARLLSHYSGSYTGSPVMNALKELLARKPYFIVTSNCENHFELAGLDPNCILEIEGSWKEMKCSRGCHDACYLTWQVVRELSERENGVVPAELVPRCPKCGSVMMLNNQPPEAQVRAYHDFVRENHDKKLLVLELGIGAGNQLIKAPLMRLVRRERNAFYVTVNRGELYIPFEIQDKSIGIDGNLGEVLPEIAKIL